MVKCYQLKQQIFYSYLYNPFVVIRHFYAFHTFFWLVALQMNYLFCGIEFSLEYFSLVKTNSLNQPILLVQTKKFGGHLSTVNSIAQNSWYFITESKRHSDKTENDSEMYQIPCKTFNYRKFNRPLYTGNDFSYSVRAIYPLSAMKTGNFEITSWIKYDCNSSHR